MASDIDGIEGAGGRSRLAAPSRRAVLAGAAALALGESFGLPTRALATASATPLRIGVSCCLTGQYAQLGAWMRDGIELARKTINANGGVNGRPVEIFYADDQGTNPTAAGNAVTKLLSQDGACALLGPHFTPAILPNIPLLSRFQVPCLTGASGPAVTDAGNEWVFRVRLNDRLAAVLLVKYVTRVLGWRRIGLSYVNTSFGQSGIASVRLALEGAGLEPVLTRSHADNTRDFTANILTFNDARLDGIIVWTDDEPAGLLVKQMRIMDVGFGLAGSTAISQPFFLELAGDAANGVYSVTDFTKTNKKPAILEWDREYANAYGSTPELYATTYHDALNLVATAARATPNATGPEIRSALTRISGFVGVMTTYTWSRSGDMVHSGLITKVEDGKPEIVETAEVAPS